MAKTQNIQFRTVDQVSRKSNHSTLSGFLSEVNEWQAIQKHDLLTEMESRNKTQLNIKIAQKKFRLDLDQ